MVIVFQIPLREEEGAPRVKTWDFCFHFVKVDLMRFLKYKFKNHVSTF
jgi:hypothetical protein